MLPVTFTQQVSYEYFILKQHPGPTTKNTILALCDAGTGLKSPPCDPNQWANSDNRKMTMSDQQKNKQLKLGNITLDTPFIQAPLSGYTDRAMRNISRRHGVPFTFAGVMLAKSCCHPKVIKQKSFLPGEDEHPVGAQLLGTDPAMMTQAARALCELGYDLIDLNYACPAPKVLRRERGGYLLNTPELAIEIFHRVREAISCPLTVKIRIGYNSPTNNDNFWQICDALTPAGLDGLAIHGRAVTCRFRGQANWDIVAQAKQRYCQTTILGSGDIMSAADIAGRLEQTGIDGIVVARGAIGNPWIFSEARALLNGEPMPEQPSLAEQGQTILDHFNGLLELYDAKKTIGYFRKFAVNYARRHPERNKVRRELVAVKNCEEFYRTVKNWYPV